MEWEIQKLEFPSKLAEFFEYTNLESSTRKEFSSEDEDEKLDAMRVEDENGNTQMNEQRDYAIQATGSLKRQQILGK